TKGLRFNLRNHEWRSLRRDSTAAVTTAATAANVDVDAAAITASTTATATTTTVTMDAMANSKKIEGITRHTRPCHIASRSNRLVIVARSFQCLRYIVKTHCSPLRGRQKFAPTGLTAGNKRISGGICAERCKHRARK